MRPALAACVVLLGVALSAHADTLTRTLTGSSPAGEVLACQVTVDYTPTGGNFAAGLGTATVRVTALNVSGLHPVQTATVGNPLLTSVYFNLPAGAQATLVESRVLAGATLYSTGVTLAGHHVPPGCSTLAGDLVVSRWWTLGGSHPAGAYGLFNRQISAEHGVVPGIADPHVFANGVRLGYVAAPLVVGGAVRWTLTLTHLGGGLLSAASFLQQCSTPSGAGDHAACAGGHFQCTDACGLGSGYAGDPCGLTAVGAPTWGAIKLRYR